MGFNLELILTIGVFVTGVIWLLDAFVLAPKRRAAQGGAPVEGEDEPAGYREPWYVEYSKSFFPVLFVVLVLRSFVVEPFKIPSGSMKPTLLVGDLILVNKFSYGLRLPVLHTKILGSGAPRRGDVVVFRYPQNLKENYIKRVVGLPGDRVAYSDKVLYINGKIVNQEESGVFSESRAQGTSNGATILTEQLGDVEHEILVMPGRFSVDKEYVVPPGHYFVMGDNRDNSNDSRFWGPVPEENLVGRAFFIWMNWDFNSGYHDFSRIGDSIK